MAYSTQPLTVTLSAETSALVRAKMAEFGYSDPEQVIEEGLAALDPEEEVFERWLQEEVLPACEEYDRDPSQGRTSEQVRETLAAEYESSLRAG